jgi:hypothetical protein
VVPGADGRAGDWPCCSLPSLFPPASACQSFPSAAGNPYCLSSPGVFPASCEHSCRSLVYTVYLGMGSSQKNKEGLMGRQRGSLPFWHFGQLEGQPPKSKDVMLD